MRHEDDKLIISQYKVQLQIENQWPFCSRKPLSWCPMSGAFLKSNKMEQRLYSGSYAIDQQHWV